MAVVARCLFSLALFGAADGAAQRRMHHRAHKHHHHDPTPEAAMVQRESFSGSTEALDEATASAEEVVKEAEKEASDKQVDVASDAPVQKTQPLKISFKAKKGSDDDEDDASDDAASADKDDDAADDAADKDDAKDDDKDDDKDDEDDSDDDDDKDPRAEHKAYPYPQPGKVKPGQKLESLTPAGRLAKARQRLQANILRQAVIAAQMAELRNQTAFEKRVDIDAAAVENETSAKALSSLLGSMRKEMRKFASPFYLEHLSEERKELKEAEVHLQADLAASEGAMGGVPVLTSKLKLVGKASQVNTLRGGAPEALVEVKSASTGLALPVLIAAVLFISRVF